MSQSPPKRPNFLILLADDLGFSDVGCFGSEISTPNIDELAASGVRMTNYYTAAACSPTRSMLLSGTDHHIAGVGVMSEQRGYLNLRVAALPELLQDNGYHTLLSGKWHLGLRPEHLPDKRGFDRSFALLPGCANHYGWEPQLADSDVVEFFERTPVLYTEDGVKVDIRSSRTCRSPHWPLQVAKEYRDKYKGVYDAGPEALRQRRLAKLKEMGLISADTVAHDVVAPASSEWSAMTDEEQALSARAMETYAGMVENMDWNIGRLLDHLEKIGERENTFIIFQSDNGAEGAALEAMPVLGPDIMSVIRKYYDNSLENVGEHNSYVWYGPRWAQASTAPGRLYKMFSTEGGIKVPMVLNYPPWTQDHGGRILDAFATVMDITPTILDLAGVAHPDPSTPFCGRRVEALRGKSWTPFFAAGVPAVVAPDALHHADDPAVGWELFGRAALRAGAWKIVFMPRWAHGTGAWELFDVRRDPGETRDLAQDEPGKVAELVALWERYVKETGDVVGEDALEDARGWMLQKGGKILKL
ncbi:aryl-sulfate sulfohydrolase [Mycena sp. CBHHK59/15]|nr:aryl-sulfate sulfohydrolase [Mycena sp. CBHHK59/15]